MNIDELVADLPAQVERMQTARSQIGNGFPWYPYDILGSILHMDRLLSGDNRDLGRLAGGLPVADIGAADGDLAFALESVGNWDIDIIDTAAANMNGLRGARALRDHLNSNTHVYDIDLDEQFELPRERYGLIFFLGILYHLQNPFYVLRALSSRCDYCVVSTRVARFAGPSRTPIGDLPVGYLVAPHETNNDPSNYWILSPAGFRRLADRSGWVILDEMSVGNVAGSDPSAPENDERMFVLLGSARP